MTPARWTTHRFTASDGLEVSYALDDFTDPWANAETVILVHAAMGSARRFYAWVPHLARHFRVARIELRGHGDCGMPTPEQLTPAALVRDVVELADHLGCRQFHVVGSSAGAIVAEKVAIDHPDRVLTLGAFAGSPGIKHGNQDHMKWLAHMREKGLATFLRETIVDRFDPKTTDPGFLDWFIEESARNSVEMLGRFVPMMKTFDVLDELSRIRCPTLAVAPGGDPIHTVDQYRVLPDLIANCEFLVYEGMPHNITDAVPDRCAQDLCRFMLKHKGGK
jgi:pimeloyl-ACP methyl ester carboxylesterase